ncbi:MAG: mechanosensitive ion channel [Chloroflexi bacterium]|nr:mechanosensitive ion channel [Chloroflexota bacterium]
MPPIGDSAQAALLTGAKAIIASVVIIIATFIGLRVWRSAITRVANRTLLRTENRPRERQLKIQTLTTVAIATGAVLLVTIGVLMVLSQFLDIAPLIAGAGIVGLALGLGAQGLIRDVISGFFILLENQYSIGDVIKVNDQYDGFVERIDLRRTVLRNLDGWLLTIPNSEIHVVANMTREWSRMVIDLPVALNEDIDRVVAVLEAVSDELLAEPDMTPLVLGRPEVLSVEAFGEYHATVRVLLKTLPLRQWDVGRRYRSLVKKAFDHHGIEFPYPHRVVVASGPLQRRTDEGASPGSGSE